MALVAMTPEAVEDLAERSVELRAVYPDFWYEAVDTFGELVLVRVHGDHLPEEDTRVRLFIYKDEMDNYSLRLAYTAI